MKLFKKINDGLDRIIDPAPAWKLFLYFYAFWFIVTLLIMSFIFPLVAMHPESPEFYEHFNTNVYVKISSIMSILLSLMSTSIISQSKKSDKFWKAAKEFSVILDNAKTKQEVIDLWVGFDELIKISMGGAHNTELTRLKAIIQTKESILK